MADERSGNFKLQDLFFCSAKNFPDRTAICFSGDAIESITYRHLSEKVKNLGTVFSEIFSQNEVVAIYSRINLNLPALLLAVMDASAAFFPISTEIQPHKVLERIKHHSVRYILVDNALLQDILNIGERDDTSVRVEITNCDVLHKERFSLAKLVENNEPCVIDWSKDLAYVMQTSGTTGNPKAVFVPHSCIVPNIVHLSSMFDVSSSDVVYLASPYTFDPSIVQMFLSFSNGAQLLITPQTTKLIPEKLCKKLVDQHHVTILQPTPSFLYYIGDDLICRKLLSENSTLSVLAIGGESCPSLLTLKRWKQPNCKTRLYNIYGITEVSSWATCHYITDKELNAAVDGDEIENFNNSCKLGQPLLKTDLIVYADNGDVVSEDGIGHLWIGGKDRQCLLEGETEESVQIMRNSGDIVQVKDNHIWYVGRSDNQIKRFGQRINLDYIEKCVCECAHVTSCTVVLEPILACGVLLHLFAVPNLLKETNFDKYKSSLCQSIKDTLPKASQPDQVHIVSKLPLTSHGKVDKTQVLKTLVDRYSNRNDNVPVDVALSKMWQESIEENPNNNTAFKENNDSLDKSKSDCGPLLPYVKPDDTFVLQGGDSLRAVQLAERIEKWMVNERCVFHFDVSMLFEIIINKPFKLLVSHIESILKSNELGISHPTELKVHVRPKRPENFDWEPLAKVMKGNNHSVNQEDEIQTHNRTAPMRQNHVCACFLKRGSERFKCSLCEDNSQCQIRRPDTLSISPAEEMLLKWSVSVEKCIDASPLVIPSCLASEGTVFIGSHSYLFLAVSLSSGKVFWRTRLGGRIESSACLSLCGQLIVVGCYDGKIYVLARNNGKITWSFQTGNAVKSSPCLDLKTGLVWVGSHDGCLYGLNINRKVCQISVECKEGSCFSSPAISYEPHYVYIGTLAGFFLCINAVSGEIQWFKQFGKPIFSSPSIVSGNIFIATVNGCLKCLNHAGDEIWELHTDDPLFSSPVGVALHEASIDCDVIVASHGRKVYRVSSGGKCEWSTSVDGAVYATPCLISCAYGSKLTQQGTFSLQPTTSDSVFILIATTKGTIYLLGASDGRILKKIFLPGEIFSSPVIVGQDFVVGCRNDFLYFIKI